MDMATLLKGYVDEVIRLSIEVNVLKRGCDEWKGRSEEVKKECDEWKEKYRELLFENRELETMIEIKSDKEAITVENKGIMEEVISTIRSAMDPDTESDVVSIDGSINNDGMKEVRVEVKEEDTKKDKRREYMKEYMRKKRENKKQQEENHDGL